MRRGCTPREPPRSCCGGSLAGSAAAPPSGRARRASPPGGVGWGGDDLSRLHSFRAGGRLVDHAISVIGGGRPVLGTVAAWPGWGMFALGQWSLRARIRRAFARSGARTPGEQEAHAEQRSPRQGGLSVYQTPQCVQSICHVVLPSNCCAEDAWRVPATWKSACTELTEWPIAVPGIRSCASRRIGAIAWY